MPATNEKATPKKPTSAPTKPSTPASTQGVDLAQLFGAATQALTANQGALNQADANGAHGDHMVQTFQLITQALGATQGKPPADQLAYASQALADHAKTSGSAKIYADGLAQAAKQYQGQKAITPDLAAGLVQTVLGGMSQQSGKPASQPASAGADLLSGLLGAATGQPAASDPDKLDVGDLLNAGMAFMKAKDSGQDNMQAAVSALVSASPLSQTPHRQQSGEVVANALFSAISMFAKK
jgi:hypothetical protein